MAMFSFTPTKNITTGEGGLVTTNDAKLAAHLRLLRNHGQSSLYRHEVLGWNWRMTEMQAAMGRVQLGRLDRILERKRANAAWLTARLAAMPGVTTPYVDERTQPVHMLYTCLLDADRDRVLQAMNDEGIEARLYFPPAHKQPVFGDLTTELPVTDDLARRMLSLPIHSLLRQDELEEIADTLERLVGSRRTRLYPATSGPLARSCVIESISALKNGAVFSGARSDADRGPTSDEACAERAVRTLGFVNDAATDRRHRTALPITR